MFISSFRLDTKTWYEDLIQRLDTKTWYKDLIWKLYTKSWWKDFNIKTWHKKLLSSKGPGGARSLSAGRRPCAFYSSRWVFYSIICQRYKITPSTDTGCEIYSVCLKMQFLLHLNTFSCHHHFSWHNARQM